MGQESTVDQLYRRAEALSQDFSLFPQRTTSVIQGLISEQEIDVALENLRNMDVDAYIAATVSPCEEAARPSAREILRSFREPVQNEITNGPFYSAEMELDFGDYVRRIGFICQDRRTAMGVWGPEHHEQAAQVASRFAIRSMPIVCFMDTPGADGKEDANAANQAHSISRLIAELCNVDVPTLGVIIGQGYSGGAIPLAASNLLVSLRTGVFNTIHPKGLANLVRRYNLSWQECAQFVGVSSYELYRQGNIDGIVDYDPGEEHKLENLRSVIISGITSIEQSCEDFVSEHPEILQHYQRNLNRYFNRGEYLAAVDASSTLKLRTSPTEYPNVFGVAFRYLRYLGLRRRIKSTTIGQYGRLAVDEMPEGKLAEREIRERRVAFLSWMQDPDQILYEDHLSRAWKNYVERKQQLGGERGRLAQLIFGEPGERYEAAREELCLTIGMHLYNRWKAQAEDNLLALIEHINARQSSRFLLRSSDIRDVKALLREMSASTHPFLTHVKSRFGYDGKKLLDSEYLEEKSADLLGQQLVVELNLVLEGEPFYPTFSEKDISVSELTRQVILRTDASTVELNRRILEDNLWSFLERREEGDPEVEDQNRTVLDIVLDEDVGEHFIDSCKNLIAFGEVY
ncbi:MAG: carboxyl transferase domain-containing protein, partial [Pseudomonadota bacterium]